MRAVASLSNWTSPFSCFERTLEAIHFSLYSTLKSLHRNTCKAYRRLLVHQMGTKKEWFMVHSSGYGIKERLYIPALSSRAVLEWFYGLCIWCCPVTGSWSIGRSVHAFQKVLMKIEMVKSWTGTIHCLKASCWAVLECMLNFKYA